MDETVIYGRNSVLEALKSDRDIEKLYIEKGARGGSLPAILTLAKKRHVVVTECEKDKLNDLSQNGNHQGVALTCSAITYQTVEEILEKAREKEEAPFLLILESIQDPHNLGAIIRTAECAGVSGIVISKHHAVGLTGAAAKTAAGALEYVPVAKVSSVAKLIEDLKKQGIWTYCADMDGSNIYTSDVTGPVALVIGGEHEGVTRLVRERCDGILSLPMLGKINSLNASVAAALMTYEIRRQRMKKG